MQKSDTNSNDSAASQPQQLGLSVAGNQATAPCAAFDADRFDREVSIDNGARWVLISGLILLCLPTAASVFLNVLVQEPEWFSTLMVGVIVAWIWISTTSTRIARQLSSIVSLTDHDPEAAEGLLGQVMTKWPIQRPVRLMFYYRLALLRHRQMRFYESAAICQCVLAQPVAATAKLRTSLLLVQTESLLHIGDVSGAFAAIHQLHQSSLRLSDRLQLLPLQIRYELMADQNEAVLVHLKERVRLAELMPSFQCGAVHRMLAVAAERIGQLPLKNWLNARAVLFTNLPIDTEEM